MSNDTDQKTPAHGTNDPYGTFDEMADDIWRLAERAAACEEADRVSDDAVAKIMTAAIKLYAMKCDGEARTFRPLLGDYDEVVTPSEALTATTEVLRALRLGPMEFGLWARRRPEDYHLQQGTLPAGQAPPSAKDEDR